RVGWQRRIGAWVALLVLPHEAGEEHLERVPIDRRGGAVDGKTHARPPATSFGRGGRPRRRFWGGAGGGAGGTTGAGTGRGRSATPATTAASGNAWWTR